MSLTLCEDPGDWLIDGFQTAEVHPCFVPNKNLAYGGVDFADTFWRED